MECNEWINVAKIMLSELTGETFSDTTKVNLSVMADSKKLLPEQQASVEQPEPEPEPDKVRGILSGL